MTHPEVVIAITTSSKDLGYIPDMLVFTLLRSDPFSLFSDPEQVN